MAQIDCDVLIELSERDLRTVIMTVSVSNLPLCVVVVVDVVAALKEIIQ